MPPMRTPMDGDSSLGPRVSVMARVRPTLNNEKGTPQAVTLHKPGISDDGTPTEAAIKPGETQPRQYLSVASAFHPTKSFQFHHVFSPACDDDEVFSVAGAPAIERVFKGRSHVIVAYGQTNTGKTFTWQNLLMRASYEIFQQVKDCSAKGDRCVVSVAAVQLYNDLVTDLLVAPPPMLPQNATPEDEAIVAAMLADQKLTIRDDTINGGFLIKGLSHAQVTSADELQTVVDEANENRIVALTGMNVQSSRSHVLVTIKIARRVQLPDGSSTTVEGKLCLADLAGCERISRTQATGIRKNEAQNINVSLTSLGNVVHALADTSVKGNRHIPFRDSRLTKLLHEYLGRPTGKATFILTVSPTRTDAGETTSVLQFGQRAMHIPKTAPAPTPKRSNSATASSRRGSNNEGAITSDRTCESLMNALEAAQDLVGTLEARVTQLEVQLSRSQELANDQEEEIVTLKNKIDESNEDAKKDKSRAADATGLLEKIREQLEEKSSTLDAYIHDNDYLNNTITTLQGEKEDLQRQCETFRASFDEERSAKSELLNALRVEEQIPLSFLTVESIAGFVRKEIETRATSTTRLEIQLKNLQSEMAKCAADSKHEMESLQQQVRDRDDKIERLNKNLESAVSARQEAAAADANVVFEVREERDKLRRDFFALQKKYAALNTQHDALVAETNAANDKVQSLTTTLGVSDMPGSNVNSDPKMAAEVTAAAATVPAAASTTSSRSGSPEVAAPLTHHQMSMGQRPGVGSRIGSVVSSTNSSRATTPILGQQLGSLAALKTSLGDTTSTSVDLYASSAPHSARSSLDNRSNSHRSNSAGVDAHATATAADRLSALLNAQPGSSHAFRPTSAATTAAKQQHHNYAPPPHHTTAAASALATRDRNAGFAGVATNNKPSATAMAASGMLASTKNTFNYGASHVDPAILEQLE